MVDDDAGALFVGQFVVRINTRDLVFDKIHRMIHLADVVVERSGSRYQCVAANLVNTLFGQIGYLQRMLKSTRSAHAKLAQQLAVGIRKLQQRNIRDQRKHAFE